jgi:hypothetical protein
MEFLLRGQEEVVLKSISELFPNSDWRILALNSTLKST